MEGPHTPGGPSQALPSERAWPWPVLRRPPQNTRQPLTLLITGLAASTAGLVVVLPGQEGAPGAREAGGIATRLCAAGCQVLSCGTQTRVRVKAPPLPTCGSLLLSQPPHPIPGLPATPLPVCSHFPLHTPPTPSATHLLGSPCNRADHSSSESHGHSHSQGRGHCPGPGRPAAAAARGPREQVLLAAGWLPHVGLSLPSFPNFRCPRILSQSSPLLKSLSRTGAHVLLGGRLPSFPLCPG